MKKRIVCYLIVIIFFLNFCVCSRKVNAKQIFDGDVYVESEVANTTEKIYLDESIANYLKTCNVNVQTETEVTGHLWWKKTIYKYYYYVNKNMLKVVNIRKLDYDLDTVIYMVEQVENYAIDFKKNHDVKQDVSDLTLGYIRCINPNYDEKLNDYLPLNVFNFFAASKSDEFINFLNDSEQRKAYEYNNFITLKDYFCKCININNYFYNKSGVYHKIDIIHLFCVIDMYDDKRDFVNYSQLTAWLGDLHQCISIIDNDDSINLSDYSSFDKITQNDSLGFGMGDLNADIDGINIATIYLSKFSIEHRVSKSLGVYYSTLHTADDTLKYKLFIDYVANLYSVNDTSNIYNLNSLNDRFVNYVFNHCGLDILGHYKGVPGIYYLIMKTYKEPDKRVIEAVTKSFCRYIFQKADIIYNSDRI